MHKSIVASIPFVKIAIAFGIIILAIAVAYQIARGNGEVSFKVMGSMIEVTSSKQRE